MKWSNRVEIVEQTNDRIVVRETPCYGAGILFLIIGLLIPLLITSAHPKKEGSVVEVIASAWMLFMGFYSLVESQFTASRGEVLRVRRSLFGVQKTREYPLEQIRSVLLRKTWRCGDGLQMQFTTGKKKDLTMSLHFQYLGDEQLTLDRSIHAFRMHSGSKTPLEGARRHPDKRP
jgi:hypothetical protein